MTPIVPRVELARFVLLMEDRLRHHDRDKGESWRAIGAVPLAINLNVHVERLEKAIADKELNHQERIDRVRKECADIGNFAWMIAQSIELHG